MCNSIFGHERTLSRLFVLYQANHSTGKGLNVSNHPNSRTTNLDFSWPSDELSGAQVRTKRTTGENISATNSASQ